MVGAYDPDYYVEIFEPGTPEPAGGREPSLKHSSKRKRTAYKKLVSKASEARQVKKK